MKTVTLNNGVAMPVLGLGTFQVADAETCERNVREALEIGYRLIDTAQAYGNEEFIGNALARGNVPREELFLTTKVWFKNHGNAYASVEESMRKLRIDYLDLVLIHWPFGDTYAAWRDLERLYKEGKTRAIGVSNYTADRLLDLVNYNETVPAVNQIETNLVAQQRETRRWMDKLGVAHQSYAPFGQGHIDGIYEDAPLRRIAERCRKTPRQVALRFLMQSGVVVIPKTTHRDRLAENFDVFDFRLSDDEMETLRGYDKDSPLIGNPRNPELVESSKNW